MVSSNYFVCESANFNPKIKVPLLDLLAKETDVLNRTAENKNWKD